MCTGTSSSFPTGLSTADQIPVPRNSALYPLLGFARREKQSLKDLESQQDRVLGHEGVSVLVSSQAFDLVERVPLNGGNASQTWPVVCVKE